LFFIVGAGIARAEDIKGTIVVTKMIFENSRLTGNVTCAVVGAPCIQFIADDITLKLERFSITGLADANIGCGGTSVPPVPPFFPNESGIDTNFRNRVEIEGPGLVQRFRFSGVNLTNSAQATVKRVTVSANCFAGIILWGSSNNVIEENVAIKNGNTSLGCGGIELNPLVVGGVSIGSNSNRIKNNLVSGNGYSNTGATENETENDFGILVAGGKNNLITQNTVAGNTIGIRLGAAALGNLISENVVVGNPPIQVSNSFPATAAFRADIRNLSPAGANTFTKNFCLTYIGAGPAPCPNFPGNAPATKAVSIVGNSGANSFVPNPVAAAAGDMVVWTNNHPFSIHRIVLDDGSYDSGNLGSGQSGPPLTVPASGVNYHCSIHPSMVGTITVTPASTAPTFK
jgi:parallel beta-helix repeat protein